MNMSATRLSFSFNMRSVWLLAGVICLTSTTSIARAQQNAVATTQMLMLPEAPEASPVTAQAQQTPIGAASVAGVVVDASGAAIERATVSLVDLSGRNIREAASGTHGEYSFEKLRGGVFRVVIKAAGFATFVSPPISLSDQQVFAVSNATLTVASSSTEVTVNANDTEVAAAQIKAAEQQRVLGFVPNFYTSYEFNAVPLSTKQKYSLALRETFDPVGFIGTGVGAGIEQANNNFKGYGQGAAGYGKRYAALYGDGLFSDLLSHAVFPSIFHQDPRYFYQGSGTLKSRFYHAVSFAFVVRGDRGNVVPNYSYLLGDLTAGAISNAYYPHADRGAGLVFTNTAIGIAGRAAGGLAREFILPRLTTNKAGAGRP